MNDDHFENVALDISKLPSLDPGHFVALDRNFLRASLVGSSAFAVVATIVGLVVATQVDRPLVALLALVAVLVLVALAAARRVLEVRYISYQIRTHDMSFRRGVISRTVRTIPFNRVQHVSVSRGLIERWFGLATLTVNSAGPNVSIPGLRADDAERLKALIVERAGQVVEDL